MDSLECGEREGKRKRGKERESRTEDGH